MTKEEAQNKIIELIDVDLLIEGQKLVDDIFDNPESRLCENCSWSGNCRLEEIVLAEFDFQDFGCTEFERKEDE